MRKHEARGLLNVIPHSVLGTRHACKSVSRLMKSFGFVGKLFKIPEYKVTSIHQILMRLINTKGRFVGCIRLEKVDKSPRREV